MKANVSNAGGYLRNETDKFGKKDACVTVCGKNRSFVVVYCRKCVKL